MATQMEQFVTLQLPTDFPRQWMQKGYTHVHFEAIRLALTYHERKGLPVTARMALLDTRFMDYQHACIITIETTLNAGTMFVTLYPNFCMSLQDPKMLTALQVQLHLNGPRQTSDSIEATLHYQMSYRVHNHALDLKVHHSSDDALLITDDYHHPTTPTCVHIHRQISRDKLVKLLPERWITNYEKLNQQARPIQSTEPKFLKEKDGSITIKFYHAHEKEAPSPFIFPTMFMMQPVTRGKREKLNDLIHSFEVNENLVYFFRDPKTKHYFWDTEVYPTNCDCHYDSYKEDDCYSSKKTKSLCSPEKTVYQRYLDDDPSVGPLGADFSK